MHKNKFDTNNSSKKMISDSGITETKDHLGHIVITLSIIFSLLLIFLGIMAIFFANI